MQVAAPYLMRRRGLGRLRLSRDRGRGCRGRLSAQYFEHHSAAGRAFSLDCLAPVFHRFFDTIDDFLLGLAFDTVSFRHRKRWLPRRFMRRGSYVNSLKVGDCQRQQRKDPNLHQDTAIGLRCRTDLASSKQNLRLIPGIMPGWGSPGGLF